jgi:heat shock protein HslJ
MGGKPVPVQGQVAPGATYDIEVDLVAPLQAGTYQAFWQMQNGQGGAFGERLPVGIRVPAAPTPTPAPTQTPVAGITFTVDRTNIKAGECVNFYWKVENVKEVYFYHEGQNWQDHGVAGEGRQQECPAFALTYYLRVVKLDNSVEVPQITIYVEESPDTPSIRRFTVEPAGQITLGQSVTIRWEVEGEVDTVTITANDQVLWGGAPVKGNTQDQPDSIGQVTYGIEAVGPGGTSRSSETIQVVGQATATPAPTPEPDLPVITAFSVSPSSIQVGDSVNIVWSTGGGTSWVTILRDEYTVLDNAPFEGSIMDQPDTVGTVTYEVLAYNPQDQTANQKQQVQVSDAAPSNPLAGTRWRATQINGVTVVDGSDLTAKFQADDSLHGHGGCNSYSASYTVNGDALSIGAMSQSQQICGDPPGVMEQEAAYVGALQSASSFSMEGGQLYINNAGGIIEFVEQ